MDRRAHREPFIIHQVLHPPSPSYSYYPTPYTLASAPRNLPPALLIQPPPYINNQNVHLQQLFSQSCSSSFASNARRTHPPMLGSWSKAASQFHSSSRGYCQVLVEHSTNPPPYSSFFLPRAQTSGSSNSSVTHCISNSSRGRSYRGSHQYFRHGQSERTLDEGHPDVEFVLLKQQFWY